MVACPECVRVIQVAFWTELAFLVEMAFWAAMAFWVVTTWDLVSDVWVRPVEEHLYLRASSVSGDYCISNRYFAHWEPLGVSEICWTRIPGWSNPRVD
jgi:hypothetical protein